MPLVFQNGELLFKDGELAMDADCCCNPCDCETDGPTAAFSFAQTNDDPCTVDLSDESVAGACGSIVAWEWYMGEDTEPFSTSQNPTGVVITSGPIDITLIVRDSYGCEDSVVMEVGCCDCEASGPNAFFGITHPDPLGDPCIIDLEDLSIAGACGAIVAWQWKLNDTVISTAQNPTGVELEPDQTNEIELTVTDAAGCEDVVTARIACHDTECIDDADGCSGGTGAACWSESIPDTLNVDVSGYTNSGIGGCVSFNGSYTVDLVNNNCVFENNPPFSNPPTSNVYSYTKVTVLLTCRRIQVTLENALLSAGQPFLNVEVYTKNYTDAGDMGIFGGNCQNIDLTLTRADVSSSDLSCTNSGLNPEWASGVSIHVYA